jgi:uncharacterized protein YwgA
MVHPTKEHAMPPISPEEAVLSIVAASPDHQIQGKKRIQKITFFCTYFDKSIAARFQIRHFGVFSTEVADALEFLSVFGDLTTREEQVGPNRFFTTVFSIAGEQRHKPIPTIAQIAKTLAPYSTPVLEVASTVAFFVKEGLSEAEAIKETKRIKPAISTPERISKTKDILDRLAAIRAADHGQRSANP